MPQVISTNIPSLNAQRNLNTSQTSLATSLQRLSSGLRINSAKDDAAGLAIVAACSGTTVVGEVSQPPAGTAGSGGGARRRHQPGEQSERPRAEREVQLGAHIDRARYLDSLCCR